MNNDRSDEPTDVLRGAGGAALAIPFLPSLTTRAFAQEAPVTIGPFLLYEDGAW